MTGEGGNRDERTPMRNKLLISTALLAAGIVLASCEKTPNAEPGAEAQNSDGSTTSAPKEAGGGQAQTPGAQEKETQAQRSETAERGGQSAQGTPITNEQKKDGQHEEGMNAQTANTDQNGPNSSQSAQAQEQSAKRNEQEGQSAPAEQKANQSSEQSEPLQQGQAPDPQQTQRQNEPQQTQVQNEPPQTPASQRNAPGAVGGAVNLSREQIRQAQTILKQKGFDVGDIDGKLGPRTRKALMAYQQQQGLQATGQIDQQTITALGIVHGSGQRDTSGADSTTGQRGAGTR
jgi:hypothetical protein